METGGLLKFSSLVGRCWEISPVSEAGPDILGSRGAVIVVSGLLKSGSKYVSEGFSSILEYSTDLAEYQYSKYIWSSGVDLGRENGSWKRGGKTRVKGRPG
jgi:hypothetical protein